MSKPEDTDNTNLAISLEQTSSLIEQLAKAYGEIEAQDGSSCDNVQWKDIEAHFRYLQSVVKKKLEELRVKEKDVAEKEMYVAEREATVTAAKEQDFLDKVQELKDAAVASVMEVSYTYSDENGGRSKIVAEKLTQFCERMDSKGLLKYVMENYDGLSNVCKRQLSIALVSASEPARLVLDALEGFFPLDEMDQNGEDRDGALHGMRQSCFILLEALFVFLSKADSTDNYLNPETKQHAKAIADEWKPKLALEITDAANGESLGARAFLWLLGTFRIATEFDDEELCKCVLATARLRQSAEISQSLELSQKIPVIVERLLENGRNIEAVNLITAFKLSDAFPPDAILNAYLKEVRRNIQGNGEIETQNDVNARELAAVKAVIECVKDNNLEAEFPLVTLRKRLLQLQNSARDKKRSKEKYKCRRRESQSNNRWSQEPDAGVSDIRWQDPQFFSEPAHYSSTPQNAFNYPVSSQYAYASTQVNDQSSYYPAQGVMTSAPLNSAEASTANAFMQPPQYSYMQLS